MTRADTVFKVFERFAAPSYQLTTDEIYRRFKEHAGVTNLTVSDMAAIRSALQGDHRFEKVVRGVWKLSAGGREQLAPGAASAAAPAAPTTPSLSPSAEPHPVDPPAGTTYQVQDVPVKVPFGELVPGDMVEIEGPGVSSREWAVIYKKGKFYTGGSPAAAHRMVDALWGTWSATGPRNAHAAFLGLTPAISKPHGSGGVLTIRKHGPLTRCRRVLINRPGDTPPATPAPSTTPPPVEMAQAYEAGDLVMVIPSLTDGEVYGGLVFVADMLPTRGRTYTVAKRIVHFGYPAYILTGLPPGNTTDLPWKFTDPMLRAVPTATPPTTQHGGCTEGSQTLLLELTPDLAVRNDAAQEGWTAGAPVTIQGFVTPAGGAVMANIRNMMGFSWFTPLTNLSCFSAAVPAEPAAPPVVPEPQPTPPAPEGTPAAQPEPSTTATYPAPPEIPHEIAVINGKPVTDIIKELLNQIGSRFLFPSPSDKDVYCSSWFMRDGSCVLKGAPGTGKTVLLTLTAFALCGEKWKIDHAAGDSHKTVLRWMARNDLFGIAQHNADKEPEDVFFYTRISIGQVKEGGQTTEEKDKFTELKNYTFKPEPRPVVNAFIKLNNESNRIGPNVADALLGLLSEKYVEYKGEIFESPALDPKKNPDWIEAKSIPKLPDGKDNPLRIDPGHLNYFDYNPHLDVEGQEMDRALLDRIDVGIYLAGGGVSTKFKVLRGKRDSAKGIPKKFYEDIRDGKVHPLDPVLLMRLWNVVDKIYVDDETLRWISFLTNLPNITVRKYKSTSYFKLDENDKAVPHTEFIDPTLISYKPAKEGMESPGIQSHQGMDIFDPNTALDAMERPLGSRASESLLALLKALTFVRHCTDPTLPLEYITNDARLAPAARAKNRNDRIMDIAFMLRYVLDHRVNLGVTKDIQENFLNFGHFIQYYFIPKILEEKNNKQKWLEAMDVIADLRQTESVRRMAEFVLKMVIKRGMRQNQESKDKILKEFKEDDPFLIQFYRMAAAGA
jgi:hypothetical protein